MTQPAENLIRINLDRNDITTETVPPELIQKYFGGSGLSAYLYYEEIIRYERPPDPLSANNPLIIMNGILTGLPFYSSSRMSICSRSPLTTIWGESNIGGHFGPILRHAGYYGIIITGRSPKPIRINIDDNEVSLQDASEYWGMGTYETIERVSDKSSSKKCQTLCIGPAGENQVSYACIVGNKGRTAGRTGMGAVMGSKNIKAIVVKSSRSSRNLSTPDISELSKESLKEVKDGFMYELLNELGTAGNVDLALDMYGDMPIKHWSQGTYEHGANLSGASMSETILTGKSACYRCPIACGREIEIKQGPFQLKKTDGPEYETLASFGTNLLIDDLEAVSFANHKANDLGLDTISSGSVISLLIHFIEKGVIDKSVLPKEISGTYGDVDSLLKLLNSIAYRKGIGDLLAKGTKHLAEYYGRPEDAPQVAGLEAAYHDPRAFSGMGLMYVTSPRGACHLNGDAYLAQQGLTFPEIGVDDLPDDRFANSGIAKSLVNLQSYRQVYNAIGICQFYSPPATIIAQLLGKVLATPLEPMEIITIGERLFAIKRIINKMLGWKVEWQRLPKIMLKSLDGPTEGNVPDVQIQLKEWYELKEYDINTGMPSIDILKRLSLQNLISK